MLEPIIIDHDASISFTGYWQADEMYRLVIARKPVTGPVLASLLMGSTGTRRSNFQVLKTPPGTSPVVQAMGLNRMFAMPLEAPGERKPTKAFSVYVFDGNDTEGRGRFSWLTSLNVYRCDWMLDVQKQRMLDQMDEAYDRWFVMIDHQLHKLPFGREEVGLSKACENCPHQFSCMAGNTPGYLIGDDLPESARPPQKQV